jgi:hypothetical protein
MKMKDWQCKKVEKKRFEENKKIVEQFVSKKIKLIVFYFFQNINIKNEHRK